MPCMRLPTLLPVAHFQMGERKWTNWRQHTPELKFEAFEIFDSMVFDVFDSTCFVFVLKRDGEGWRESVRVHVCGISHLTFFIYSRRTWIQWQMPMMNQRWQIRTRERWARVRFLLNGMRQYENLFSFEFGRFDLCNRKSKFSQIFSQLICFSLFFFCSLSRSLPFPPAFSICSRQDMRLIDLFRFVRKCAFDFLPPNDLGVNQMWSDGSLWKSTLCSIDGAKRRKKRNTRTDDLK